MAEAKATNVRLTEEARTRFDGYTNKSNGCWEWSGRVDGNGYGRFTYKQRDYKAHRLAWVMHCGQIPASYIVCHTCDNRRCVNPEHLYLGDARMNSLDAIERARMAIGSATGSAKLDESDVAHIVGLRISGISVREIACQYGVSVDTIKKIFNGAHWSQVTQISGHPVPKAAVALRPTHRHHKGGLYRLLGYAKHTEEGGELAIYQDGEGRLWARPREIFEEPGRFAPLQDNDLGYGAGDGR